MAVVPPSCDTPMTSASAGGSSDSSNACAAIAPGPGSPAARAASRRISTVPSAACSDVPQPVTMIARPARAAVAMAVARAAAWLSGPAWLARIRRATAGSAAIMSVMWYGGPERRTGVSVEAQGSGGPGRGALGSKPASVVIDRA